MARALTVTFDSQCAGTNHVSFNIFINGAFRHKFVYNRSDLLDASDLPYEDIVLTFLREAIKAAGATTVVQARTAIEARTWSV